MIQFDDDYIDRLNRQYESGKWLKTVILTETTSPLVKRYWVDHEVPIVFDGNTYEPLHMNWSNLRTSQSMPTEGAEIALSNLAGQVAKYVKTIDVSGNEVILQRLHLDLLTTLTQYEKRKLKVLGIRMDRAAAVVTVGRNLGRNRLPRRVILRSEFPGVSNDVPRIL